MLNDHRPDMVVAFPGGRGTANMIALAKSAGVEVIEVGG
jgi:UDP-N-acetylmuramoylalanine-D-glutamate ligase